MDEIKSKAGGGGGGGGGGGRRQSYPEFTIKGDKGL